MKNFDYESVSFETENIGNGTILRCVNAGEDVELVSTWFAHEEDANLWKSFLENMANTVVHSINFTEEQRDTLIAERDSLKAERDELSAKLDIVKNSVKTMFDAISIEEPSSAPIVGPISIDIEDKGAVEEEISDDLEREVVSLKSLDKFDQARYYKILGYNNKDVKVRVKGSHLAFLDPDNLNFSQLCTEQDESFIQRFGGPLFSSKHYMSSKVRKQIKHIISWLSSNRLSKVKEGLAKYTLSEVAGNFNVHPAYIWAICVGFEIPFVNDNIPNFSFEGEPWSPGNIFSIPDELEKNSHKVHLIRACKILGYNFDDTITVANVGNPNVLLDKFQLNWRKLGTDEDEYMSVYSDLYPFEDGDDYSIESCSAVHKYLKGYKDDIVEKVYDWGIDKVAETLKVPGYYLWAFCILHRINFTAKHRVRNAVHGFIFEESN